VSFYQTVGYFINKAGNTLLAFKQTINKLEYFFYVFNKLSHYCSANPRLTSTRINGKILMVLFSLLDLILFYGVGIIFFMSIKKR